MKHRDRVTTALNHEKPDRCPMQISFTPEFADRLEADIRLKDQGLHNPHGGGNTYELERALDEDMLLTSVGWVNGYYKDGYQNVETYEDEWGVTWKPSNTGRVSAKGNTPNPSGTLWQRVAPWRNMYPLIRIDLSCILKLRELSVTIRRSIGLLASLRLRFLNLLGRCAAMNSS